MPTPYPIDRAELKTRFRNLVEAAIKKLDQQGRWPPPPGIEVTFGTAISYWDVWELPELESFQAFLRESGFVTEHYYPDDSEMWHGLLMSSLDAARLDGGLEEHFSRLFGAYFKELIRPNATWELIETMTGITCEAEFRLDAHTLVKPLDRWHRRPLVAGRRVSFEPLREPSEDDKLALVYSETGPKSPGDPRILARSSHRVSAFTTACRLLLKGDIRRHCFAEGQRSSFPLKETIGACLEDGHFGHYDVEAHLSKTDIPAIRRLWKSLLPFYEGSATAFSKRSRLEEAMNRFLGTYQRQAWVDDIVDLTIAVEALLSPSDQQELSFRVSLRAAQLLGTRGEPSVEAFNAVRTMYSIRSATVHGSSISGEDALAKQMQKLSGVEYKFVDGLDPLFSPATEAARSVVRRLIIGSGQLVGTPSGYPGWPLPDDFDRLMLDKGERRRWQRAFQSRKFDLRFST